jgi:hypothetical protein
MSIVSLVIAPTLADMFDTKNSENDAAKQRTEQSIPHTALKIDPKNTVDFK